MMKQTKAQRIEVARTEWVAYLNIAPEDRPYRVPPNVLWEEEIEKGYGPLYSKVGHTKECDEANHRYMWHVHEFTAKYPGYCRTCGGWGVLTSSGCSVPYGSTYVSLPDEVDLCPDCLEKELCPRCGQPTLDKGGERCGFCGWEYERSDGLPEAPGCICPDVYLFVDDDWEV